MAENNQIIAATIQVDTGNSSSNVAELNKGTSQLKSNLKDVGATASGTGKNINDTGEHFGKLKGQIAALPGPMNQLTGGVSGLNQAFNILKANPIIGIFALVAGLVIALFEKFKKMEAVSDSLGKAWGSLSTIFNAFLNKILTPLIDAFTTFIGLFTKAASWIVGIFSPGLSEAAKRGGELAEALDDLNDAEAKSAITRAESNRKLQEARDLANDANVPIKERIEALKTAGKIEKEEAEKSIQIATQRAKIMLEQIALELGARDELIQAIRNGSMEQLKAARDEIYAMKNVDKEKLKAIDALIIDAENTGAEQAKINKKTESGITQLEKEEQQKRKEQRDKAIADHKQAEQKLNEFRTKLRQLQQDNELSQIKDGYAKELRALEIKLDNDKKANEAAIKAGNLTRQQGNQLNIELQKQYDLKVKDATDKHNKEVLDKEAEFQTKLAKLKQEILLGGIVDQRQLEREQLKISHEDALKDAAKQYADDAEKLNAIKLLIDDKYRQDKIKQDEKFAAEDLKKKQDDLEKELGKKDKIVNDEGNPIEIKQAALDAEQKLIEDAFNKKIITEEEYNKRLNDLSVARGRIAEAEHEGKKKRTSDEVALLNQVGELIGKQTVAGKALGIATALINTWQGASDALRAKSTLPSPFDVIAKVASVATVVATGLKTVKSIAAVNVPGGGGGGSVGSLEGLTPSAPVAPTVNTTKIDADSINQINNQAAGGVNRTQRAYVLNGDIQNESEREARLQRAATLGGI